MRNPLLEMSGLPPFPAILPEHVEPAVDTLLAENRAAVATLLEAADRYTWENLAAPIEAREDRLARAWSPVSHMNAVVNSEELRAAYTACLPKLSAYQSEMGQNERLFHAYQSIAEGPEYAALDPARRKMLDNILRDFRLSGVALPSEKKTRFKEIQSELARLFSRFSDNLLDATNAWSKEIADTAALSGLPGTSRGLLRKNAEREGLEGWLINLEFPSYNAVMTYADDPDLRREVYEAYVTRASDQGPHAGRWDNGPVMEEILRLRHEGARLLGFHNYAERSLATKMAGSTREVLGFLRDLARRSRSLAQRELDEIRAFAAGRGTLELQAWDIAYFLEKWRQERYDISQEGLRPYFPEDRVLTGLFEVVRRLYGVEVREVRGAPVWHPDVRFFDLHDDSGALRGRFYLDLHARPRKRGGAWMDDCIGRRRTAEGGMQIPVAYLTCNFSPPVNGDPALFTHDEVLTLFHEFGHGLHHMLTRVEWLGVSGINGVPWDAVELPSQFMENWCWEREALDLVSGHFRTGEPLPEALHRKMLAARNFQAGMQMVRQIEFALFDFRLHGEPPGDGAIQRILDEVREEVAVVRPPAYNRFQNGFSHIFASGYAAGYYSYKWAEVLSADAFSRFEEEGIFNRNTGRAFLSSVLEQGGARDPTDLFVEFRGRKPGIDALLRHNGIAI